MLFLVPEAQAADEFVVAAAADLQFAMPEVVQQFEKETGQRVRVTFGSSGNFASQIQNGAPFDIFFSADLELSKTIGRGGT